MLFCPWVDLAVRPGVDTRLEPYPVDDHAFRVFWSFLPEAADGIEAGDAFIRPLQAAG